MKNLILAAVSLAAVGCADQPPAGPGAGSGGIRGVVSATSVEGAVLPFAHAVVSVYRIADDPPPLGILRYAAPYATGLSDAQGGYLVAPLPAGSYTVVAADPAFPQRYGVSDAAEVVGGGEARVNLLMLVDTSTGGVDTTGGGVDTSGVDTTGAPAGPVASVTVSPARQTISAGDSAVAIAMTFNAAARQLMDRTITWTISDSTVVSVTQAAYSFILLHGVRSGTVTLTATSEGVSGVATVTVR